jgi:hypothetical protein
MKKLVLALLLLAVPRAARADVGIGFFLGDPTGLDLKLGLDNRSGLDIVLGVPTFRDRGFGYGHLTYLVTPWVGHGSSVLVPIRLGIGGAVYGDSGDLGFGARAPLEVGFRFRRTPLEIYGEIAVLVTIIRPYNAGDRVDLQGGIGMRFFL